MNSDEINKLIRESESNNERDNIFKSSFGDKIIPYIGWFWRDVNFDYKQYTLGICPNDPKNLPTEPDHLVGFMVNNKWGY